MPVLLGHLFSRLRASTRRSQEVRDPCPICFKPLSLLDTFSLPCGHVYHVRCIGKLLRRRTKAKCPICRASIDAVTRWSLNILQQEAANTASASEAGGSIFRQWARAIRNSVRVAGRSVAAIGRAAASACSTILAYSWRLLALSFVGLAVGATFGGSVATCAMIFFHYAMLTTLVLTTVMGIVWLVGLAMRCFGRVVSC